MSKRHQDKRRRRETKHVRRRIARALFEMHPSDVLAVEAVVRHLRAGLQPGAQIIVDVPT